MKATQTLLVAALAVAGLAITMDVQAQNRGGGRSGGSWSGGGHSGGNWSHGGGGRYYGYRGGYYRGGYWGPGFGLYLGAPLLAAGWGYPYYYGGYYPGTAVYQNEYPQSYIEQPGELLAPSTEVPMSQGAPTQGPMYMNYCESAKAYFPKVSSCPEGWKLATPAR
jgi:hypothetical protein